MEPDKSCNIILSLNNSVFATHSTVERLAGIGDQITENFNEKKSQEWT